MLIKSEIPLHPLPLKIIATQSKKDWLKLDLFKVYCLYEPQHMEI